MRCGLIQNQDRRIFQDRAGNGKTLFLPAAEAAAAAAAARRLKRGLHGHGVPAVGVVFEIAAEVVVVRLPRLVLAVASVVVLTVSYGDAPWLAIIIAATLLANVVLRRLWLPLIGVGVWLVIGLVIVGIVPGARVRIKAS